MSQQTPPRHPKSLLRRFDEVVPSTRYTQRVREVAGQALRNKALGVVARIPGARRLLSGSEAPVLHSDSRFMYNWYRAPYGTPSKPASLAEVPWDYVESHQDEIPFLGLREYWYPALLSKELAEHEPKPLTLLGDNLVLFRDAEGEPRALENRCPHRGPLLSLGQVGAWAPGTITCRYHGMTFDGEGECVAYIADGPDSPMCGKVRARSYPTTEHQGVVWVYMGEREAPSLLDSLPHGRGVLGQSNLIIHRQFADYSHLNILDNTVDMAHVGCLHRTCAVFGDQKPYGEVGYETLDDGGLRAFFREPDGHAGPLSIDEIRWYLPNMVYHGPGELGFGPKGMQGWFWFVPRDVGSFVGWIMMGSSADEGPIRQYLMSKSMGLVLDAGMLPGLACFAGGDAPMQASQGRVVRWDQDKLTRTDRAVIQVRKMMKDAHAAEIAERTERGTQARTPRLQRP